MQAAFKVFGFLSGLFLSSLAAAAPLHHSIEITLTPAVKSLAVIDTISVTPGRTYRFSLNKNLAVTGTSAGDSLRLVAAPTADQAPQYELIAGSEDSLVTLQYSGVIFDPVVDNNSSGLISTEGASLFGDTGWLPEFGEKTTYEIRALHLPPDWKLASPLAQTQIPQPEIYLIAGAFTEYTATDLTGTIQLKVYLRSQDPHLAQTFLSLLPGFLDHYQKTLGAYPYPSFAVIENFWETGFGMPAFTLLGPGVVRLPYILNSSLPHELLHNWWGNSVFVDYNRGNWCEGLTTYLADHWQQELLKADGDYRRQSLMNFQDYTRAAQDFPLRDFKQRFNFSSQAVGYGKGMMLFHMLRVRLGETVFARALKDLYQNFRGQSISYDEIEKSFEGTARADLKIYFKQWLDRTGAPVLKLGPSHLTPLADGKYQVDFELQQASPQNYELHIPVRFTLADGRSQSEILQLSTSQKTFQATFNQTPKTLEVDPGFDVFRDLDKAERPLSLSNVFGAKKIYVLGKDEAQKTAYQKTWAASLSAAVSLSDDGLLLDLPPEGAVLLLGDAPEYEQLMTQALSGQEFQLSADAVTLFGTAYPRKDFKTAVVARSSTRPDLILMWVRGEQVETLAPRLLHYGKFGVLAFSDKAVPLKATWPILKSPLRVDW